MLAMPQVWWLRPVRSAARVGEHSAVVWKWLYFSPFLATRPKFGVGIGPPKVLVAPNPVSSVMMSRMFGAPLGAATPLGKADLDSLALRPMTPPNGGSGTGRMGEPPVGGFSADLSCAERLAGGVLATSQPSRAPTVSTAEAVRVVLRMVSLRCGRDRASRCAESRYRVRTDLRTACGRTDDRCSDGDRAVGDSIRLRPDDRESLLRHYRSTPTPAVRLRCHVLLLLDTGHPWVLIAAVLFTSSATINRWRRAYLWGGIDALLAGTPVCQPGRWWVGMIVRWVLTLAPANFGFARSRWTCEAIAIVLHEDHGVRASRETVRRRLRESELVCGVPARSSAAETLTGGASSPLFERCSVTFRRTRRRCSWTRSRCTPTRRSARCGCGGASRRRWRRPGTTRSGC